MAYKNIVKSVALIYLAYAAASFAKVILAGIVGHDAIKIIDIYFPIQFAVFLLWLIYATWTGTIGAMRIKLATVSISIVMFIPVVALSLYVSFVLWLEIGLPY